MAQPQGQIQSLKMQKILPIPSNWEKTILKASQNNGEQIQKKITVGLSRNTPRKSTEEEIHCVEIKKCPKVYGNMNYTYQKYNRNKMAEDMKNELERTTAFYPHKILSYGKRAQENWMAALLEAWQAKKRK